MPREHALHRPRHGGKQLTAIACALVFFAAPTLSWVFGARPTEIENHKLATFPGISDGWGFFTGLPAWATDQLAFRAGAIDAADGISRGLFGEPAPMDAGGAPNAGPLPGATPPPPGEVPAGPDSGDGGAGYRKVIQGSDGWLYFGFDTEAKCAPVKPIDDTAARFAKLRDIVEKSGRKFVLVVPPDKTTIVPDHLPANYPGKECALAASPNVWQQITSTADAIDLRGQLRSMQQQTGKPIYPPNDTHWTDDGAIVMTKAIAEAVDPGITQTWRSSPTGPYQASADLPPLLGKSGTKTNTAYDLKPDGESDRTQPTALSLDMPNYRVQRPVPGAVPDKALVLGDSFTLASSRYLPGAFADLTMLAYPKMAGDPQKVIDLFAQSDVVVVEAVERVVSSGGLPFLEDSFIDGLAQGLPQR